MFKIRVSIAILYLSPGASCCNLVIVVLTGDQIDSTMLHTINVSKKAPAAGEEPEAKKPRTSRSESPSPAAVPMTGTFHETFRDFKGMNREGVRSDIKIIGGFPWRLGMLRDSRGDLKLFIECTQSQDTPMWYADFEAKITLLDAGYGSNLVQKGTGKVSHKSCRIRTSLLDAYLGIDSVVAAAKEGAPTVDYVSVEVVITVKEAKGDRFRPKPTIDIFTPNAETYDGSLTIGDKKIHVNKQFLVFHSPFFKDLFSGKTEEELKKLKVLVEICLDKKGDELEQVQVNFPRKGGKEIQVELNFGVKEVKVDGITPEDFAILLGYFYRIEDKVTVANWETLAKLAHKFDVQELKDSLECWLTRRRWSAAKKLAVASKYGMESYQEVTLAEIRSDDELKKVKESEEWKEYKKEMKERIEAKEKEIKEHVSRDADKNIAEVEVAKEAGDKSKKTIDFLASSQLFDADLTVGEKKIYVDKKILSLLSPVFQKHFFGNPKEEIKFNDEDYQPMIDFLRMLYRVEGSVTAATVEGVLQMAHRFKVQPLIDHAEKWLCSAKNVEVSEMIRLAEMFALHTLMRRCLRYMRKRPATCEVVMHSEAFKKYSDETKKAVRDAMKKGGVIADEDDEEEEEEEDKDDEDEVEMRDEDEDDEQ